MYAFQVRVLRPRPSTNQEVIMFTDDYAAARKKARKYYFETGRPACVTGEGEFCWFHISETGEHDRNMVG